MKIDWVIPAIVGHVVATVCGIAYLLYLYSVLVL
jgi:hypothetical protein